MIRAVIDPSVLVSAFIGHADAAPARLVRAALERRCALVVSPQLIEELREVLSRPKFARWSRDGRAESYVAALVVRAEQRSDQAAVPSAVRDPKDEYLVALARAAGVDWLVSLDRDLLDAGLADLQVVGPRAILDAIVDAG